MSLFVAVGLALIAAALLITSDQWGAPHSAGRTLAQSIGWAAAMIAILTPASGSCCSRGKLARLFRRRTERIENPYRDIEQP